MNENIKEIIAERIKYHSNKQKYGYFMGNDCIDICASDILDDVIKAGYRKQSETVKEFEEKLTKAFYELEQDNYKAGRKESAFGVMCAGHLVYEIAKEFGKEE